MTTPAFTTSIPLLRPTSTSQSLQKSSNSLTTRVPCAVLDEAPIKTSKVKSTTPNQLWTPASWRSRTALQQPTYPDLDHLHRVEQTLSHMPPLVSSGEMRNLKNQLASVCNGHGFVLQGGDCAESLNETANNVKDTVRALYKMAVVLMWGSQEPVVKIGRIGGQYGKPRSSDTEIRDGVELPSYRGEVSFFFSSNHFVYPYSEKLT